MTSAHLPSSDPWPERPAPLEEACAAGPRDMAALLLFALSRRIADDRRPVLVTAPRVWFAEHGRPYGPGAAGVPLILAPTTTASEALWTLEQALRSGAVALALGAVTERPWPRRVGWISRRNRARRWGWSCPDSWTG